MNQVDQKITAEQAVEDLKETVSAIQWDFKLPRETRNHADAIKLALGEYVMQLMFSQYGLNGDEKMQNARTQLVDTIKTTDFTQSPWAENKKILLAGLAAVQGTPNAAMPEPEEAITQAPVQRDIEAELTAAIIQRRTTINAAAFAQPEAEPAEVAAEEVVAEALPDFELTLTEEDLLADITPDSADTQEPLYEQVAAMRLQIGQALSWSQQLVQLFPEDKNASELKDLLYTTSVQWGLLNAAQAETPEQAADDYLQDSEFPLELLEMAKTLVQSAELEGDDAAARTRLGDTIATHESLKAQFEQKIGLLENSAVIQRSFEKTLHGWVAEFEKSEPSAQRDETLAVLAGMDIDATLNTLDLSFAQSENLIEGINLIGTLPAGMRNEIERMSLWNIHARSTQNTRVLSAQDIESIRDIDGQPALYSRLNAELQAGTLDLAYVLALGEYADMDAAAARLEARAAQEETQKTQAQAAPEAEQQLDNPMHMQPTRKELNFEQASYEFVSILGRLHEDGKAVHSLALAYLPEKDPAAADAAYRSIERLWSTHKLFQNPPVLDDAREFTLFRRKMEDDYYARTADMRALAQTTQEALTAVRDSIVAQEGHDPNEVDAFNRSIAFMQSYHQLTNDGEDALKQFKQAISYEGTTFNTAWQRLDLGQARKIMSKEDSNLTADVADKLLSDNGTNETRTSLEMMLRGHTDALPILAALDIGLEGNKKWFWQRTRDENAAIAATKTLLVEVNRVDSLSSDIKQAGSPRKKEKLQRQRAERIKTFNQSLKDLRAIGNPLVFTPVVAAPVEAQATQTQVAETPILETQVLETPELENTASVVALTPESVRAKPRFNLLGWLSRKTAQAPAQESEQQRDRTAENITESAIAMVENRLILANRVHAMAQKVNFAPIDQARYQTMEERIEGREGVLNAALEKLSDDRVIYWLDIAARHENAFWRRQDYMLSSIVNLPNMDIPLTLFGNDIDLTSEAPERATSEREMKKPEKLEAGDDLPLFLRNMRRDRQQSAAPVQQAVVEKAPEIIKETAAEAAPEAAPKAAREETFEEQLAHARESIAAQQEQAPVQETVQETVQTTAQADEASDPVVAAAIATLESPQAAQLGRAAPEIPGQTRAYIETAQDSDETAQDTSLRLEPEDIRADAALASADTAPVIAPAKKTRAMRVPAVRRRDRKPLFGSLRASASTLAERIGTAARNAGKTGNNVLHAFDTEIAMAGESAKSTGGKISNAVRNAGKAGHGVLHAFDTEIAYAKDSMGRAKIAAKDAIGKTGDFLREAMAPPAQVSYAGIGAAQIGRGSPSNSEWGKRVAEKAKKQGGDTMQAINGLGTTLVNGALATGNALGAIITNIRNNKAMVAFSASAGFVTHQAIKTTAFGPLALLSGAAIGILTAGVRYEYNALRAQAEAAGQPVGSFKALRKALAPGLAHLGRGEYWRAIGKGARMLPAAYAQARQERKEWLENEGQDATRGERFAFTPRRMLSLMNEQDKYATAIFTSVAAATVGGALGAGLSMALHETGYDAVIAAKLDEVYTGTGAREVVESSVGGARDAVRAGMDAVPALGGIREAIFGPVVPPRTSPLPFLDPNAVIRTEPLPAMTPEEFLERGGLDQATLDEQWRRIDPTGELQRMIERARLRPVIETPAPAEVAPIETPALPVNDVASFMNTPEMRGVVTYWEEQLAQGKVPETMRAGGRTVRPQDILRTAIDQARAGNLTQATALMDAASEGGLFINGRFVDIRGIGPRAELVVGAKRTLIEAFATSSDPSVQWNVAQAQRHIADLTARAARVTTPAMP